MRILHIYDRMTKEKVNFVLNDHSNTWTNQFVDATSDLTNVYLINSLCILKETFTNNFNSNILIIVSIVSILCGISIVISKNPIVSVLFLIGLFLSIAGYLMTLGINFIGLSYLLVYVGAVSILFLFILMLINIRISELSTDNSNSIPLAIAIGIYFLPTLYKLLPYNFILTNPFSVTTEYSVALSKWEQVFSNYNDNLWLVTSNIWDGALSEVSHITTIGSVIYTNYPLWLIVTSLILLLAMVGAIVITIKQ